MQGTHTETEYLDFRAFLALIPQLAYISFSRPPVDLSHLPVVESIKKMLDIWEYQAKLRGEPTEIFKNPDEVGIADKDVVHALNEKLRLNPTSGQLQITIEQADLTHDTEFFGKMDPFCVMKFKGKQYKTETHEDGGKNPVWNQTFNLYVADASDPILFNVQEEDVIYNDDVGDLKMTVSQLIGSDNKGKSDWYQIVRKGKKSSGKIQITTVFKSTGNFVVPEGYQKFTELVPVYTYRVPDCARYVMRKMRDGREIVKFNVVNRHQNVPIGQGQTVCTYNDAMKYKTAIMWKIDYFGIVALADGKINGPWHGNNISKMLPGDEGEKKLLITKTGKKGNKDG